MGHNCPRSRDLGVGVGKISLDDLSSLTVFSCSASNGVLDEGLPSASSTKCGPLYHLRMFGVVLGWY